MIEYNSSSNVDEYEKRIQRCRFLRKTVFAIRWSYKIENCLRTIVIACLRASTYSIRTVHVIGDNENVYTKALWNRFTQKMAKKIYFEK